MVPPGKASPAADRRLRVRQERRAALRPHRSVSPRRRPFLGRLPAVGWRRLCGHEPVFWGVLHAVPRFGRQRNVLLGRGFLFGRNPHHRRLRRHAPGLAVRTCRRGIREPLRPRDDRHPDRAYLRAVFAAQGPPAVRRPGSGDASEREADPDDPAGQRAPASLRAPRPRSAC